MLLLDINIIMLRIIANNLKINKVPKGIENLKWELNVFRNPLSINEINKIISENSGNENYILKMIKDNKKLLKFDNNIDALENILMVPPSSKKFTKRFLSLKLNEEYEKVDIPDNENMYNYYGLRYGLYNIIFKPAILIITFVKGSFDSNYYKLAKYNMTEELLGPSENIINEFNIHSNYITVPLVFLALRGFVITAGMFSEYLFNRELLKIQEGCLYSKPKIQEEKSKK